MKGHNIDSALIGAFCLCVILGLLFAMIARIGG